MLHSAIRIDKETEIQSMNVLILAAGRGSRLGDLTSSRPKVLSSFRNRTLFDWHIENVISIDPELRISVVVGYKREQFVDRRVSYIYNPLWESKNIGSSLMAANELLSSGCTLVLYGDVFYEPRMIASMLSISPPCVASVSNWDSIWTKRMDNPLADLESFSFDKDSKSLLEIGQKPSTLSEIEGQFAGVFTLDRKTWQSMSSHGDVSDLDCTSLIQREIISGRSIRVHEYRGEWREFDLPTDFIESSQKL